MGGCGCCLASATSALAGLSVGLHVDLVGLLADQAIANLVAAIPDAQCEHPALPSLVYDVMYMRLRVP